MILSVTSAPEVGKRSISLSLVEVTVVLEMNVFSSSGVRLGCFFPWKDDDESRGRENNDDDFRFGCMASWKILTCSTNCVVSFGSRCSVIFNISTA